MEILIGDITNSNHITMVQGVMGYETVSCVWFNDTRDGTTYQDIINGLLAKGDIVKVASDEYELSENLMRIVLDTVYDEQ